MWVILKNTENICKIKYLKNFSALTIHSYTNRDGFFHTYWDYDGVNDVLAFIEDKDKARKLYYLYTGSYVVSN